MLKPRDAVEQLQQHPAEAGAGLIAIGLLLKVTALIKIVSYVLLTFGLILIWEAFRQKTEPTETNDGTA